MDTKRLLTWTVLVFSVFLAQASWAEDASGEGVVFFRDVLPILQENCQACHRPLGLNMGGMVAPMALTTYEEVRPWAKGIARQVEGKNMPPWHASPAFQGVFSNERTLSDEEISTLVRWAKTGARRGNPADAPEPIDWPQGEWGLGEPDLVVEMPEPYFVEDDVEDLYIDFTTTITDEMLSEPRYIAASEAKPGSQAVHHIIARPIGGLAPGVGYNRYPDGYGPLLVPGTKVTFQMHYHKEPGPGTGVWDQSKIAVKFHTKPVDHPVRTFPVGNMQFEIPPGHANWRVGANYEFTEDMSILSLLPHMHLRGKDAKYVAFYPDGTSEVLLDVPRYDFNWQTSYRFKELKRIPAGTRIEFTAHYDNSDGNLSNPDPDEAVRFGQPTTAEMMLGWMTVAPVEPQPVELPSGGDK